MPFYLSHTKASLCLSWDAGTEFAPLEGERYGFTWDRGRNRFSVERCDDGVTATKPYPDAKAPALRWSSGTRIIPLFGRTPIELSEAAGPPEAPSRAVYRLPATFAPYLPRTRLMRPKSEPVPAPGPASDVTIDALRKSLRASVAVINEAKRTLGTDLNLTVKDDGTLGVLFMVEI